MTYGYATMASTVALALLATPTLAQSTDRREAFEAWRAYCFDVERPRTEAVETYCAGFRSAASFLLRPQAGGLDAALSLALAAGDAQHEPEAGETTAAASAPPGPTDPFGLPLPEPAAIGGAAPQDRSLSRLEANLIAGAPRGGR